MSPWFTGRFLLALVILLFRRGGRTACWMFASSQTGQAHKLIRDARRISNDARDNFSKHVSKLVRLLRKLQGFKDRRRRSVEPPHLLFFYFEFREDSIPFCIFAPPLAGTTRTALVGVQAVGVGGRINRLAEWSVYGSLRIFTICLRQTDGAAPVPRINAIPKRSER